MTSKKTLSSILLLIAVSLCLTGSVVAQEVTGAINGTVRDASGAVVPGATVTITDPSKNGLVVRSTTTNDDGEYSAPNLPTNTFDITVEAPNFKKSVSTGIKVDVGQRRTVDVALTAGNISETVTVEADRVSVELSTPTAGTTINGDQVREIPINNRNFVQLVALAPGVSNDLSDQVYVGTTNPEGQANTINISVNGARSSQNTFTVDGADVTDRGSNITIQAYPSVDSIGEFKVLRSLFPAESGRSGGGQVNIVTRSGSHDFHGSAFEFVRNEIFNANNFLANSVTTAPFGRGDNGKAKRAPFHYNNFGWTLGGPIFFLKFGERDPDDSYFGRWSRTFFFFSQEFRRDSRYTAPIATTVPSLGLRNGTFPMDVCINQPGQTCTGANILPANSPLPANRYSPAALAYVNQIYKNLPLPNSGAFGLISQLRNVSDFQQEIIKIDHSFSDQLSGYYRYERDEIPTIDGNALFSSGGGLPDVSTTSTNSPGRTHTLQMTYTPSSNFILEGRYNYSYGAILSENIGLLALTRTTIPITLPFANQRDRVPSITGNGFTGLTSFGPYDNFSDKHTYTGTATWLIGSHTFKFGGMHSMYRKNENALAGNNEGLASAFSNALAPGVGTGTGQTLPAGFTLAQTQAMQQWAQFLVGNVTTFSQASFDYTADLRQKAIEGFIQDEWKVRPNLTLYAGIRYSFFGSPWDKNGRLTNFIPEFFNRSQMPVVTGTGNRVIATGIPTGNWCNGIIANTQNFTTGPANFNCSPTPSPWGKFVVNVPKTDFAPRVGFAWDPFKKGETSVRAGYGIYHEQILNGIFLQNIGLNPPYQQNASLSNVLLDNPAGSASISATVPGLRAVQSDWKTPYMQHWSLDVQHQLTKNTVVTVGYYGSKGTNLIGVTELNEVVPGLALSSTCAAGATYIGQTSPGPPTLVTCQPPGYAFRNATTPVNNPNVVGTTRSTDLLILDQLRPFRGYRSIAMIQPRYGSNYHSLQVFGQHRFSGSSQLNAAYTWSKNLTDAQTDRNSAPQNSYNARAEWGRATLDRRHVMNFNYVYELPWFDKQKGFIGKALGGIQLSGIATYQTGLPFTAVTSNIDYAGVGLINANPTARPNSICNPNTNAPQTRQQWFDISCIPFNPAIVTSGTPGALQNTFGTAGRGTIEGPSTKRVDFTTTKNLRFGESIRLQLRWEIFNIFNWTNFRTIGVNNTLTTWGQVTAVRDPRTMQFGAKFSF